MRVFDISLALKPGMVAYPGNPEFRIDPVTEIRNGGSSNSSLVTVGTHAGTHVDAPRHVYDSRGGVDTLPLDSLVGPARVIRLDADRMVEAADLESRDWAGVERVLLRTPNSDRWAAATSFNEGFIALSGGAAAFLGSKKLRLVGVDYLSVDRFRSGTHPAHHALLDAGVTILEGLDLSGVDPGDYELFVGPMKIPGADGAPARVFLIQR